MVCSDGNGCCVTFKPLYFTVTEWVLANEGLFYLLLLFVKGPRVPGKQLAPGSAGCVPQGQRDEQYLELMSVWFKMELFDRGSHITARKPSGRLPDAQAHTDVPETP